VCPCVRVCVCPRVRARVGVCMCACAWVMGFVSLFFSRGCVRVGACVCACARVGGVGCRAAGTFGRGRVGWICTIHHEHKGISHFPSPRTQRDKIFTFTTTQWLFTLPTNPRAVILHHEHRSCLPQPEGCPFPTNLRVVYLFPGCLSIGFLVVG
jgi:hypothetical protein